MNRMIACANIHEVDSIYRWKGKITEEKEWVIIAKTVDEKWSDIQKEVRGLHPDEGPCILRFVADANEDYLEWMNQEL